MGPGEEANVGTTTMTKDDLIWALNVSEALFILNECEQHAANTSGQVKSENFQGGIFLTFYIQTQGVTSSAKVTLLATLLS